jgi:type I restriction enzyme R subunit
MDLPETRPHREALAFALSPGFWEHLDVARIRTLHDTFAPLMPLRSVRERGEVIRLTLPDRVTQRHWILYGPAGEGAFVETYRAQVEAFIQELAENSPALQRLRAGEKLTPDELDEVAHLIERPDLFITESRLREAYELPNASLSDFLSHILGVAKLANREEVVGAAFDDWVNRHPHLNAAQILFVRALRREVLNRARIASLDSLRQPPFNRLGDPESLFSMSELKELLALAA